MKIFLYSFLFVSVTSTFFLFQNCSPTTFKIDPVLKQQALQTQSVFRDHAVASPADGPDVDVPVSVDQSGDTTVVPPGYKPPEIPVDPKPPVDSKPPADPKPPIEPIPLMPDIVSTDVPVSYYCSTRNLPTKPRVVETKKLIAYLADAATGNLLCQQAEGLKESIINKKEFKVSPCFGLEHGKTYELIVAEESAFDAFFQATAKPAKTAKEEQSAKLAALKKLIDLNVLISEVKLKASVNIQAYSMKKSVVQSSFEKGSIRPSLKNVSADTAIVMFAKNFTDDSTSTGEGMIYGYANEKYKQDICDLIASPLIVSLNPTSVPTKAIELTAPLDGILFDILGARSVPVPHSPKQISWLKKGIQYYYFITLPKQGEVNGIDELFGDNTRGTDGNFAANGYLALAKYDSNKDKMITQQDPVYKDLRLWRDDDRDGKAQPYELYSLEEMQVTKIDLTYDSRYKEVDQYGNETQMKSVVETKDGQLHLIFDLWFRPIMK